MPTLGELLSYCPETGLLTWRNSRGRVPAGAVAGTLDGRGYVYVRTNRKNYLAHRLAWFLVHGEWADEIDHINRNRSDNRLANLRKATRSQNNANTAMRRSNSSGCRGVSFDGDRMLWRATISANGQARTIGRFASKRMAAEAYRREAAKLHGEFAGERDENPR